MGEDGKAFHVPPVRILKMEEIDREYYPSKVSSDFVNPKISQILIGGHYIT